MKIGGNIPNDEFRCQSMLLLFCKLISDRIPLFTSLFVNKTTAAQNARGCRVWKVDEIVNCLTSWTFPKR